jgi:hypothetical protein
MKRKSVFLMVILALAISSLVYIQISSRHIDKNYYRNLAWEVANHNETILDWKKADVSLININKSPANTPPVFSGKLNRFLLFLNGGRAVRVEFFTTQDGMLGPIVLYFNPFTKKCVGGDIRM